MSPVVGQGLCGFIVLTSWLHHSLHTSGRENDILFMPVWTAGASMRKDCLLNHHISMEIGLYQMSLPPCGLCFSDILGEEKKKVHVVSNIPGKIPLFEDLAVLRIGHCDFH